MAFDLKALIGNIEKEVKESEASESSGNNGPKILYPFHDGDLKLRILFNPKSNTVQRRIVRHNAGKGKVPCLQVYGEECPVCKAISDVENCVGKECGVFNKYGYQTRGICYAQVVDAPAEYLKGDGAISIGEIVLFMYPKSLYTLFNEIMLKYTNVLDDIIAKNRSNPFVISRKTKKGGFPEYTVILEPFASNAFEDKVEDGKVVATGDEIYEEALNNLPNLLESIVPRYPDENTRTSTKTLAETIVEEYMNSNVVNPHDDEQKNTQDTTESSVSKSPSSIADSVPTPAASSSSPEAPSASDDPNNPDCLGKYEAGNRKCMLCIKEVDCMQMSNK